MSIEVKENKLFLVIGFVGSGKFLFFFVFFDEFFLIIGNIICNGKIVYVF